MKEKIIPIKWINEGHDSDWDKVPNFRDCQPFNPNKQDKPEIRRKKELLVMEGDISDPESFHYRKLKKIMKKHEGIGKKRFEDDEEE